MKIQEWISYGKFIDDNKMFRRPRANASVSPEGKSVDVKAYQDNKDKVLLSLKQSNKS
jgi:hypothetical protein